MAARYIAEKNNDGDICDGGEYYPGLYASGATDKASDLTKPATAVVAWFNDVNTHPTALKKANGPGLYDMSGNVAEFCFEYFTRGGSTYNFPSGFQVGRCDVAIQPYQVGNYAGFRLARTP